jgi:peptidoglycan/xylan/chitin deacetylase (PgdA/CDA1 family)
LFTTGQIFEKQLEFLKKWYRVITFEELENCLKRGRIPWNLMIITFDDGYEDIYLNAYRILKKYNLKAAFFIAVNRMENQDGVPFWWDRAYYYLNKIDMSDGKRDLPANSNEVISLFESYKNNASKLFEELNDLNTEKIEKCLDEIGEKFKIDQMEVVAKNRTLSWEQICAMGIEMEIGSHSFSHRNLIEIEKPEKIYEIKESARTIERNCGKRVLAFSYPGGKADEETEEIVRDAGYKFAVTTRAGVNDLKNPLALKRINIWEGTSLTRKRKLSEGFFSFKLAGFK